MEFHNDPPSLFILPKSIRKAQDDSSGPRLLVLPGVKRGDVWHDMNCTKSEYSPVRYLCGLHLCDERINVGRYRRLRTKFRDADGHGDDISPYTDFLSYLI